MSLASFRRRYYSRIYKQMNTNIKTHAHARIQKETFKCKWQMISHFMCLFWSFKRDTDAAADDDSSPEVNEARTHRRIHALFTAQRLRQRRQTSNVRSPNCASLPTAHSPSHDVIPNNDDDDTDDYTGLHRSHICSLLCVQ